MVEDLLRKYQPSGPPPDLRVRIVANARPAWPWAAAAAAMFAAILAFHAATSALAAGAPASGDAMTPQDRVSHITEVLGGSDEARRMATLIVMEEEIRNALPPVAAASHSGDRRQ